MSSSTRHPFDRVADPPWESLRLAAGVRATGFWTAVAVPFGYLYLLWGGLSGGEATVLLALLALNLLSLVVGHGHNAE